MKKTILLFSALLIFGNLSAQDKAALVNPIIGTNGMGHTFPGACVPFGLVQLSPDTDTIPHNVDGKYQPRVDQSADAWKEAIKKLNITWPQMSDLKYWNCEGAQLYAVSSIPHTVLIDGEGTILARGLHGDELQEKIAEAVK